jgi:hypothetical protein
MAPSRWITMVSGMVGFLCRNALAEGASLDNS